VTSTEVNGIFPVERNKKMAETMQPTNGHATNSNGELYIPGGANLPENTFTRVNQGPRHPLEKVVGDSPAKGTVLQMETGLFEHGLTRARMSGATKPVADDQKALEEHACTMARKTYCDGFDPRKHPHDKVREDEYQHHLEERTEAQKGTSHARANLRDADNNLAKTPKAGEAPAPNPWLVAAAIITINISIAPTLHDRFFYTLGDDLLAWLVSLIGAGFVAALLTLAIITGRKTIVHWIGLAAGIGVGIALAVIRLSTAENTGECMFALGLTIFEVAAVLLLEFAASGLRDAEDKWTPARKSEDEAIKLRDAAQGDLNRWTSRLEEINKAIRDHIGYVEDRATRNLQVSELEAVAMKAVLDGYNAGITENLGRILGVRRPQ
jgi:hypothetical protein